MDTKAKADLHAHTVYSDGRDPPEEVVALAAAAGISALAITDHESVGGIDRAMEAAKGNSIEVVPGIELAGRMKKVEVHILGLWIDHGHPEVLQEVELVMDERRQRAEGMVEKLQQLGVGISMEDVEAAAGRGGIARPHIAQALLNAGTTTTYKEAFKRFIGRNGPAYVPRQRLAPERVIELVHDAGGVAVLAHGLVGGPQREHVKMIADMGVDAIEVVHPKLDPGQSAWLREFARGRGLGVSGGSDWHGQGWSEGGMGDYCVDAGNLHDLAQRRINTLNK